MLDSRPDIHIHTYIHTCSVAEVVLKIGLDRPTCLTEKSSRSTCSFLLVPYELASLLWVQNIDQKRPARKIIDESAREWKRKERKNKLFFRFFLLSFRLPIGRFTSIIDDSQWHKICRLKKELSDLVRTYVRTYVTMVDRTSDRMVKEHEYYYYTINTVNNKDFCTKIDGHGFNFGTMVLTREAIGGPWYALFWIPMKIYLSFSQYT